jgi:quercetin dioxygenase-like cupin family protein
MFRRMVIVLAGLALVVGSAFVGAALATPSMGVTVTEQARGELDRPINANISFDSTGSTGVKIKTKGRIEFATQRVTAVPGATFGWHSHPGPTVVVVLKGTLTLYHDEDCTHGIKYGPGTSFHQTPDEFHLAKNEEAEELVIFASYFVPVRTPPIALRIDRPSPGAGCPQ